MRNNKSRLKIYLFVFVLLMMTGIIGFMVFEKYSFVDSVYFSIVTMATVGYGDIHPQSVIGKMLAMVIIIGGVGTFLGVIASITDLFVNRREEFLRNQKLNMVTGLFFSEMGSELLKYFIMLDPEQASLYGILKISADWQDKDFDRTHKVLKKNRFTIDSGRGDLSELKKYIQDKVDLLLRLIENPAIQEHEYFTDLLQAVLHLRDELINRSDVFNLSDPDRKHLEGDIIRSYKLLISEWLRYMQYLKKNYGYLFSLAIRINPFDPLADAAVKDSDHR